MFDKFMRFLGNPSNTTTEVKEMKSKVVNKSTRAYPEAVVKIHSEFNTAGDILFEQCMELINSSDKNILQKAERLKKLGFNQVEEIKRQEKVTLTEEIVELVSYYRRNYPFNKFITPEQVSAICTKYNLVMGDVSRFKGFVPERNLTEIENFKLRKEDGNQLVCRTTNGEFFTITDAVVLRRNSYDHIYKKGSSVESDFSFQRNVGQNEFYSNDGKNLFGLRDKGDMRFTIESNSLQICAPLKDMDITGMRIRDNRLQDIPDPVVLQAVKGGYLIVTAWGDEASDELVVNEINN